MGRGGGPGPVSFLFSTGLGGRGQQEGWPPSRDRRTSDGGHRELRTTGADLLMITVLG